MTAEVLHITGADHLGDARVQEAVVEVCRAIQERFADAAFRAFSHPHHRGAIVEAYVDQAASEQFFVVTDPVIDRLIDLLVEEDISIHVWPCERDRLVATSAIAS